MNKPINVFLSSTYDDLAVYREYVRWVLTDCGTVYRGMEVFGASATTPLQTSLKRLEESDLVISILGTHYGSCPDGSDKSFIEIEIDRAIELDLPIWIYILDEKTTPVLREFIDLGEAALKLDDLKKRLRQRFAVEIFTTPENLGTKILSGIIKNFPDPAPVPPDQSQSTRYRESAYDALAEWYDHWYAGHWNRDQPFETICTIIGSYLESDRGNLQGKRVLDVACGTGNAFVAFSREGFDVWGTDGSHEMLLKARSNCESVGISTSQLVLKPVNWTNRSGYLKLFEPGSFDLIINTANSFCHLPPGAEYVQTALRNFHELLKPGGFLIIDTKKYIRSGPDDRVPTFKELRFDGAAREWIERSDREEPRKLPGIGDVRFHTRLMYDSDPSFDPVVRRALIIITIHGPELPPRTLVVPYYPLPANLLQLQMTYAGFESAVHPAYEGLNARWPYDMVVGRRTV